MAGEEQAAKKPRTEADIKGMTNKQYLDTVHFNNNTICQRNCDPFYIVTCYT